MTDANKTEEKSPLLLIVTAADRSISVRTVVKDKGQSLHG